jgi:hypothetical protein
MSTEDSRSSLVAPGGAPSSIDTSVAHPARRYDYWLGGKDNFAADRESGDAIRTAVVENRRFLHRAVSFLAGAAGIRQFLDIGTGLPELVADISSGRHGQGRLRTRAEFARFFDGLDLVAPGVVPLAEWRADDEPEPRPTAAETAMYAGVARIS